MKATSVTRLFAAAGLAVSWMVCGPVSAATIISDDFESYANDAALDAVWTGPGTLDTAFGNPGQSLLHAGTASTNTFSFPADQPTGSEVLRFMSDIYDTGTSNKRVTAGLRAAAGSNILEMGMYNSPVHYAYRVILFASGNPNWVAFSGMVDDSGNPINNAPVQGWHRYTADITATSATFKLDLNSDGIINATANVPLTIGPAGFDIVRLGGPSSLSSLGGGANFDNVHLELIEIPEPATLTLAGLSLLALAFAPRRRAQ